MKQTGKKYSISPEKKICRVVSAKNYVILFETSAPVRLQLSPPGEPPPAVWTQMRPLVVGRVDAQDVLLHPHLGGHHLAAHFARVALDLRSRKKKGVKGNKCILYP